MEDESNMTDGGSVALPAQSVGAGPVSCRTERHRFEPRSLLFIGTINLEIKRFSNKIEIYFLKNNKFLWMCVFAALTFSFKDHTTLTKVATTKLVGMELWSSSISNSRTLKQGRPIKWFLAFFWKRLYLLTTKRIWN